MADKNTRTENAPKQEQEQDLSFGEALERLEEILQRIESDEIDIDELATELRSGAELLELCRGKIRRAEVEVSQVVQSLGDDD